LDSGIKGFNDLIIKESFFVFDANMLWFVYHLLIDNR
jgi:hypothetical protein